MLTETATPSRPFVVVLARDKAHLTGKLQELKTLGFPFLVICGERVTHPRVKYRKPIGKWDAINFARRYIPSNVDLMILNDADTKIYSLPFALACVNGAELVFCKVKVSMGPQKKFYRILDQIRSKFPIAASGELMLISRRLFERILPLPPSTAEDTLILFRALELRQRVRFCPETYVITERPVASAEEQAYKLRTTLGIYQALRLTKPPPAVRIFYFLLPLFAVLLASLGPDGRAWVMGIERAVVGHLAKRYSSRF